MFPCSKNKMVISTVDSTLVVLPGLQPNKESHIYVIYSMEPCHHKKEANVPVNG